MSALVFLLFTLGYLHSSEAYEQLSLTDFLLDFLLSLWVPYNYVPSAAVRSIPDPVARDQMISVEKSRIALDNFIQHLLRYASENPNGGYDYISSDAMAGFNADSSQIFNSKISLTCSQTSVGCDYLDQDSPQVYPNPTILTPQTVPYPNVFPTLPVQVVYPTSEQPPNEGMFGNRPYELHTAHYHGNKLMPAHIHFLDNQRHHNHHDHEHHHHPHQHHHHHHHHESGDDDIYLPPWDPTANVNNIPTTLPDNFGQIPNLFTTIMPNIESGIICDPNINPIVFNSIYCGPIGELPPPPFFFRGAKRNAPNIFPGQSMNPVAQKILYLDAEKNIPNGVANRRMSEPKSGNSKEAALEENSSNPKTKKKRESNLNEDFNKVNAKSLDDLFRPNFLDGFLTRTYRQNIYGTGLKYSPQYSKYDDPMLANRLLDKNLNPKESIVKDDFLVRSNVLKLLSPKSKNHDLLQSAFVPRVNQNLGP